MQSFADRLHCQIKEKRSALVVGLDPRPHLMPPSLLPHGAGGAKAEAKAFMEFASGILEAVQDLAVCIKFQSAFYEKLGGYGLQALKGSLLEARKRELLTILDAKRGDIGSTAKAYAEAQLGDLPETPGPLTDSVTVNPYLGEDSIRPFVEAASKRGKGLFVLVKTSNPSGKQIQDLSAGNKPVYLHVAELLRSIGENLAQELKGNCGISGLGAVVGATYPGILGELRRAMPENTFLLPGVGAQGGKVADLAPAFISGGKGALISASRSIIYAYRNRSNRSWIEAAREEARKLVSEYRALLRAEAQGSTAE